jgi:Arc/MetJ-type ribon-helix-helix transcriptional regulator
MRETIHIRMPDQLVDAVASAAARRFQTVSEFTRQALLDRLRQDGLDPARADGKQQAA